MASPSNLVRKTVNSLLDFISKEKKVPMIMPSEQSLSELFKVSRSTLTQAYEDLTRKKLVRQEERARLVLRSPKESDYFRNVENANSKTQVVENFILEKFTNNELKSGDRFSELQIAKELGANTVTVREVLLKISGTGLIKKTPRKQWEVIDLSVQTMSQITDYRMFLELHGLKCLLHNNNLDSTAKEIFKNLKSRHQAILSKARIDRDKIIEIEHDFHKSIVRFTQNEFMQQSYDSLFIVSRFHLRQKGMTQERFRNVIKEHLVVIDSILKNDYQGSVESLKSHFAEAKVFFEKANNNIEQ